jgi:ATP-dependent DNA ligase
MTRELKPVSIRGVNVWLKAVCKLGLEGIVSKKLNAPYKSGPSRAWLKTKNPKAPTATRAVDGTF